MPVLSQTVIDNFDDDNLAGAWDNWGGAALVEDNTQIEITVPVTASTTIGMDRGPGISFVETWYGTEVVDARPAEVWDVMDDFGDAAIGPTPVNWATGGSHSIAEASGVLTMTIGTGAGQRYIEDGDSETLSPDEYWGMQCVDAGVFDHGFRTVSPIRLLRDDEDRVFWRIHQDGAQAWQAVGGGFSGIGSFLTYDPEIHQYWAIGKDASGNFRFMWSTDGLYWTVHHTLTDPFGDAVFERLGCEAGNDALASSGSDAVFDNYINLNDVPGIYGSLEVVPASFLIDDNNSVYWQITNGLMQAWQQVAGVATNLLEAAYVPATHVFFAIGINALGRVEWLWSTDGATFTSFHDIANPLGATSGYFGVRANRELASLGEDVVKFDNFSSWVTPSTGNAARSLYNQQTRRRSRK